jgi:two-component system OmpR family sensor kinase
MNGTGRLSLRARLLVVLIAVTAAFLLIMGGVTAFVLSKRLGAQFDDSLLSAAARSPGQIQANPGDYVAVEVTHRFPPIVQPLTGSGAATQTLANAVERAIGAGSFGRYVDDTPFTVPGTLPRLRAVARLARADRSAQAGILRRPFAVLVVARPMAVVSGQVGGIVVAELITGGGLILLLALGGRWLIGRGLAPLSEMAGTAQRITTEGDLTARMPDADGSTEVGRLGAAINTMLDRIQQAFGARLRSEAKVRQFAADASHELRTPLTTIRGYAELYRQGALGDDQLPDAMRRIEQEARRMGTLVAELLELARLDRTSSLDIADTDLAVLVRDAVADARAVEPARPVRAEVPDSLVAAVDEARIRQVLANLLGNVREHTPVATPTAVRLAQVRGGVVLEVADGGPGMATDDASRAFDRFYRGAELNNGNPGAGPAAGYGTGHGPGSARSASPHSANGREAAESGGSGLGLAIVAAIAQAHGGQATLESAPGRGTRVRVWLPANPPAPPRAAAARPPRSGHASGHPGTAAPVFPQPGGPPPGPAGPPSRQPLPRPARPSPQPLSRSVGPPARLSRSVGPPAQPSPQPLSGPGTVGHPVPPRSSLGPVGYPVPPSSHSLSRPVSYPVPPSRHPVSQPASRPVPPPSRHPVSQPASRPVPPPSPHKVSRPASRTVPVYAAPPAELHHDWGDPPRAAPPPRPPASRPGQEPARRPGCPAPAAAAPRQGLPPPGRHRRAEWDPRPPDGR